MILQTFQNPVWTVSEVGAVHVIAITFVVFLFYNLFDSIREIISDWEKRNK